MDNKQQPVALKLAEMLPANEWLGHVTLVSYARECVAELLTQHAHITELESQLAQRFDAADMATAAAQGFREGVASVANQPITDTNTASGAADLRTAAQAVVDRWDTPLWKDVPATAEYIGRLRAALAAGQATAAQAVVPTGFLHHVIALCTQRGYSPENIEAWSTDDKWIADLWRQAAQMLAAAPTQPVAEQANADSVQPAPSGATEEVENLRKALVYAAFALHDTPQYMLAQGITLIDGDTVRVSRDGWTVEASVNPHRQPAPAQPVAEPADTVVLNAAMRAIQQAIELIGAPTDERMRAVRRVLRGAVIVAEDAGKVAPQPSPTAQSADSVQEDAARYRWLRDQPFDEWKRIAWHVSGRSPTICADRDAAIDAARAAQKEGE